MYLNKIKNAIHPPCDKCPYKLGTIQTLVNPCPHCKSNNYSSYNRFVEMSHQTNENDNHNVFDD